VIAVQVLMKLNQAPLKRTPVSLRLDADGRTTAPVATDRAGIARFDLAPASGTVLVDGIERYHGVLNEQVHIELWSITQSPSDPRGAPGELPGGNNAYPGMTTRALLVDGSEVLTDGEGYLVDPGQWSEGFVRAQASAEGLVLTDAHWEVIRYLRQRYAASGQQATVRDMIRHFRRVWGAEAGSNGALHRLFPRGGPQKQGNRLAGLLRTKGEH